MRRSCLDTSQLCIQSRKAAWGLYLDAYVLNDDGNVLDAIAIAAVAALKNGFDE